MKRIAAVLGIVLCTTLLGACGARGTAQQGGQGRPTVIEETQAEAVTLAELLSCDEFDAVAAGVADGSNLPTELYFSVANGYDDIIFDQGLIVAEWSALCDVRVDAANPASDLSIDDGSILFSFVWPDGSGVSFPFETSEYFDMGDGTFYRTADPSAVQGAVAMASDHLDARYASADGATAEMDELTGTAFEWDVDGDGVRERFSLTFHDNGDEAPSAIEVSLEMNGEVQSAWIDGAYGVTEVVEGKDETGSYLSVTYLAGDYYSHDRPSTCLLRVIDGTLTVEYPD